MTVVVDASVAIEWFVPDAHHEEAQALLYTHGGALEAPDLLLAEVANIARTKFVRKELTLDQVRAIPAETRAFLAALHPSGELIDQAVDIAVALDHSVYACLYLACAAKVGATLATADEVFLRALDGTDYRSIARFVGEFSS